MSEEQKEKVLEIAEELAKKYCKTNGIKFEVWDGVDGTYKMTFEASEIFEGLISTAEEIVVSEEYAKVMDTFHEQL